MGTKLVDKSKPLSDDCPETSRDSAADKSLKTEERVYRAYGYSKEAFRSGWANARRGERPS